MPAQEGLHAKQTAQKSSQNVLQTGKEPGAGETSVSPWKAESSQAVPWTPAAPDSFRQHFHTRPAECRQGCVAESPGFPDTSDMVGEIRPLRFTKQRILPGKFAGYPTAKVSATDGSPPSREAAYITGTSSQFLSSTHISTCQLL